MYMSIGFRCLHVFRFEILELYFVDLARLYLGFADCMSVGLTFFFLVDLTRHVAN